MNMVFCPQLSVRSRVRMEANVCLRTNVAVAHCSPALSVRTERNSSDPSAISFLRAGDLDDMVLFIYVCLYTLKENKKTKNIRLHLSALCYMYAA